MIIGNMYRTVQLYLMKYMKVSPVIMTKDSVFYYHRRMFFSVHVLRKGTEDLLIASGGFPL